MTCLELQESLVEIEDGGSAQQQAHLRTCPECSALAKELLLIASSAVALRAADEPSPRVWNSIEIALRKEGLIRAPRHPRSVLPWLNRPGAWARWLVPAAAALLILLGIRLYQQQHARQLSLNHSQSNSKAVVTVAELNDGGLNDEDLLQEVASQSPAVQAQYADNLRAVNQSIQDAKSFVDQNPNDDEARRSLLEAYQQKAMLFELAMDRSLP